jgi:hypothetical protein
VANVLVLLDGEAGTETGQPGTFLYDLTGGRNVSLPATLGASGSVPGELNMGSGQTLADFVTYGRALYPSHHTLLAIVDHGGGWAPSPEEGLPGTLPLRHRHYLAGGSGLSWDFPANTTT